MTAVAEADTGAWPKVVEEPYVAECPAGGHDAAFTGEGYGNPHNNYEFRVRILVACAVCP